VGFLRSVETVIGIRGFLRRVRGRGFLGRERLDGHQRCAETTKASSSVLVCFALSWARFKDEMQHAKQHPSLKSRTDYVEIRPADGLN
jgi:hypothetical protein